jgi:hypothetical protein
VSCSASKQCPDPFSLLFFDHLQESQSKARQPHGSSGVRVISGAFWGLLIGLIFFVPFLGYLSP